MNIRDFALYMTISYDKIFVLVSRHNWNWPSSGAFVFHKHILFYNYIVDGFHHLRKLHTYLKNNVKCIKFFFDKQEVLNYRTASLTDWTFKANQ